jgi:hypothetical protein
MSRAVLLAVAVLVLALCGMTNRPEIYSNCGNEVTDDAEKVALASQ